MNNSSRINLDVVSPLPPVPPNIYKVSEDITVNEGSNVTLSCLASGRPDPAITWRLLNPSGKIHPIRAYYHLRQSGRWCARFRHSNARVFFFFFLSFFFLYVFLSVIQEAKSVLEHHLWCWRYVRAGEVKDMNSIWVPAVLYLGRNITTPQSVEIIL